MRDYDPTTEFTFLPDGRHRINHCYFDVRDGERHWERVLEDFTAEGCGVEVHRHPNNGRTKEGTLNFIVTLPAGTAMFAGTQASLVGTVGWPIKIFLLPSGKCATILHSQEGRTCRTLLLYDSPRAIQHVVRFRENVPEELRDHIWRE